MKSSIRCLARVSRGADFLIKRTLFLAGLTVFSGQLWAAAESKSEPITAAGAASESSVEQRAAELQLASASIMPLTLTDSISDTPVDMAELTHHAACVGAIAANDLGTLRALVERRPLPTKFKLHIKGHLDIDPINAVLELNSRDNCAAITKVLLSLGADPNISFYLTVRDGSTVPAKPLEVAILRSKPKMACVLVEDPRTRLEPSEIFAKAALLGHQPLVRAFLARPDGVALLNIPSDNGGDTPLMGVADSSQYDSHLALVQDMIALGADTEAKNNFDCNAFDYANRHCNPHILALLKTYQDRYAAQKRAEAAQKRAELLESAKQKLAEVAFWGMECIQRLTGPLDLYPATHNADTTTEQAGLLSDPAAVSDRESLEVPLTAAQSAALAAAPVLGVTPRVSAATTVPSRSVSPESVIAATLAVSGGGCAVDASGAVVPAAQVRQRRPVGLRPEQKDLTLDDGR